MSTVNITLDKYKPRFYQVPVFEALEKKKFKRLVVIWPRRSGKEIVGYNIMIRAALRRVGTYFFVYPNFSSGRRILWDAITNTGERILDYLPAELVDSKNEMMMRIKLKNGSIIQIIGSDNYDNTLIGTNPVGIIFSEYSIQDERAYAFSKPILAANDGWCLFLSTPRGKNHLFTLWDIAQHNPDVWWSNMLTVKETKHISEEEIEADIARGEISWDLAQQEYYCSFDMGIDGAVYGTALDRMKHNEQIGNVPWQSNHRVNTAWDVGNDMTSIVFYQTIGQVVNVIDYYEKSGEQLEYYVNYINSKPYTYGKHFFPHDMRITEWGGKKYTRVEKARQLGVQATIVDSVGLEDGIEYVKSSMAKIWMDAKKTDRLITCLENYRYEYDRKHSSYKNTPLHDRYSHGADAFRYACLSMPKTGDSLTQADIDKQRREALYGNKGGLPPFFRDDNPWNNEPMPGAGGFGRF
jgi:phage terminase large subunit